MKIISRVSYTIQHDYNEFHPKICESCGLKNKKPLQPSDREKSGDPDHHKDDYQVYQQLNLESPVAKGTYQSYHMCQGHYLCKGLQDFRKALHRENHTRKKEHRRQNSGQVEIKVVDVLDK